MIKYLPLRPRTGEFWPFDRVPETCRQHCSPIMDVKWRLCEKARLVVHTLRRLDIKNRQTNELWDFPSLSKNPHCDTHITAKKRGCKIPEIQWKLYVTHGFWRTIRRRYLLTMRSLFRGIPQRFREIFKQAYHALTRFASTLEKVMNIHVPK